MELFIANNSVYHQKSGFLSNIPSNVELWIAKVFEEKILLSFIWQYLTRFGFDRLLLKRPKVGGEISIYREEISPVLPNNYPYHNIYSKSML